VVAGPRLRKGTGGNGFDVVVVGGGIVGIAAERELLMGVPGIPLAILDKEAFAR
jgi:L-2-hydroxyglutarate oxidase LhgO